MSLLKNQLQENDLSFEPRFFRIYIREEEDALEQFLQQNPSIQIHDQISSQLDDLIKSKNPSRRLSKSELEELKTKHLGNQLLLQYGVWIYYPWSHKLVHTLDEEEFIEVRTNRNHNKITKEEQKLLNTKKIGIVGLSVGQSIALTIAMERICGELRLADFDTAELSNLNRLRTGIQNLGVQKTIIAAREIAEIDPFLKVKLFNDGLNKENMTAFFTESGHLDLFIEVCDGLDIKIESRFKARELKIPVVMDTNDRGMLDVERFDLEPQRPVLHGFIEGLNPDNIKDLTNEQKIPHILKMVGADSISTRLKASMIEVEQSINTWPQLASSVVLGGALTTDVSRRILLDQYHDSGRYYVDFDEIVGDKIKRNKSEVLPSYIAPPELTKSQMLPLIALCDQKNNEGVQLDEKVIREIVEAGILAPSGGNAQPWKFIYHNKELYIFHDKHFSHSLLDYNNLGSYLSIGAVIENISIKSSVLGLQISTAYFPLKDHKELAAIITYKSKESTPVDNYLGKGLDIRLTNRNLDVKQPLPDQVYAKLKESIDQYEGAELFFITDENLMKDIGDLLATTEMLRIIHPRGHYDTFNNELRWTPEENEKKRDGLDVNTLGVTGSEIAALKIADDPEAIALVREMKGGKAFKKMVNKSVAASAALGIITMPEFSEINFLKGGRAVERIWIEANLMEVSFQPISQLVFMLARLKQGHGEGMDDYFREEFEGLNQKFHHLLPHLENRQPIFIFRLAKANEPEIKSLRRPVDSSFIYLT